MIPRTQIQRLFAIGEEWDKIAEKRSWDTTDEQEPDFVLRILLQQEGEEKDRKRRETVAVAQLRLRIARNNE